MGWIIDATYLLAVKDNCTPLSLMSASVKVTFTDYMENIFGVILFNNCLLTTTSNFVN